MSTVQQVREGLSEAWDTLVKGWRKLYRRAAGALTRFTPARKEMGHHEASRELAIRSSGWGLLAAEVYDDDDRVVVRMEAPGLQHQDFDLQVVDDCLVVRGHKQMERERTEGRYHVVECAYGSFERAIPLPDEVDSGKAKASYRNGVLRVELPKTSSGRRKVIRVDVR